ncbi:MAG: hypothetical protein FJX76_02645 [Armatimonadetes bacterium]|nr:hypothetical protein [Armatimonadota bacterium]
MLVPTLCSPGFFALEEPPAKPKAQPAPMVDGLAAMPDTWIPQGNCRAYVTSPWGADNATVTRNPRKVSMDLDAAFSPDVEFTDLGSGRVKAFIDMPWPLSNIKAEGPMTYNPANDTVHFQDERTPRTADMWQLSDGRVHVVVHDPQRGRIDLQLTRLSAKNP